MSVSRWSWGLHWTAAVAALVIAPVALADPPHDDGNAQQERLRALTAEVVRDVEELRGWQFRRPVEKTIRSREQLAARLEREIDEQVPPELMRRREAFLKMTGIVPRHVDVRNTWVEMLSAGVAAFYDTDDQTFHVIDDIGRRYGPLPLGTVIAHELTHALDDQHIGLDGLVDAVKGDSDREFAVMALIEGSATALMTRYMVRKMEEKGLGAIGATIGSAIMMTQDAEAMAAMQRAPRYFQTVLAAYTLGQSFFFWTNITEDGRYEDRPLGDAVLRAAADPPRSSQQIIHPENYWDPEGRIHPVDVSDEDVQGLIEALDHGLRVVHQETAGELLMAIVTEPEQRSWFIGAGGAEAWTNDVAKGWAGDRFFVIESEDADENEPLRGLWITVWQSEAARDGFVETYDRHRQRPPDERQVFQLGDAAAVYLFGPDDEVSAAIERRLREAPPAFSRAGEPWPLEGVEEPVAN